MASTIEQIMAELDRTAGYASDRNILQSKYNALPGQSAAEISGLDAKLTQANDNILQGARSRGIGFSGIPIQEQAQYAATDYAPAVARVKQSQNEQQLGILSSLNALSRDQRSQAQSIYDNEMAREAAAAAARAASAAAYQASAGDYLGGGGNGGDTQTPDAYASVDKQSAANALVGLFKSNNAALVKKTLAAITASAKRGNIYDKYKLELINMYKTNSPYAGLLLKASGNIKAPAKPAPKAQQYSSPLNRLQNAYKMSGPA